MFIRKLNIDNNNQFSSALIILNVASVDDVIVSFKRANDVTRDDLDQIKTVWTILENYIKNEKIKHIGIADVEEATFRAIYDWANIKPSIIQINLATCCVVPPSLQAFCKDKEVKLLTHSDPSGK